MIGRPPDQTTTAEYAEHAENCIWRGHKKSSRNETISTHTDKPAQILRYVAGLWISGKAGLSFWWLPFE